MAAGASTQSLATQQVVSGPAAMVSQPEESCEAYLVEAMVSLPADFAAAVQVLN